MNPLRCVAKWDQVVRRQHSSALLRLQVSNLGLPVAIDLSRLGRHFLKIAVNRADSDNFRSFNFFVSLGLDLGADSSAFGVPDFDVPGFIGVLSVLFACGIGAF